MTNAAQTLAALRTAQALAGSPAPPRGPRGGFIRFCERLLGLR
jgi:hypothetical protein